MAILCVQEIAQSIPGYRMPGVVLYSYDHCAYDLRNSRVPQVPEDQLTVFRMLKIHSTDYQHVISNVLVDSTSAERIVLVNVRIT